MLSYITRGDSVPYKKPKVYFTCHSADFDKNFPIISEDILKIEDCVIYYNMDVVNALSDENKRDINEMNLIVVPITYSFLADKNSVSEIILTYAMDEHIPVLPILMNSNLVEEYSKNDLFGNLQFLDRYNIDGTQISYEEKLKTYLQSVLLSDEMTQKVRASFDAYIFLSYRKKDRMYANSLMRMIHNYPMCRDIAIWYDEYLIPGEDYNRIIYESLTASDFFVLLVTPNLINEANYVQSTEYPVACKQNKTILPIEMESTNRELLKEYYEGIPECVNCQDETALHNFLHDIFKKHSLRRKQDEPEHDFLIGLAYLEGIDVEIDRKRALELITMAASSGLPEGMKKLIDMYSNGIGVSMDLEKAKQWSEELGEVYLEKFGEKHPDSISALNNLAIIYQRIGDIEKAHNILYNIFENAIEVYGYKDISTIKILSNLAYLDNITGNIDQAIELYNLAYNVYEEEYGDLHHISLVILNNLASCYVGRQEYEKAKNIYEEIYLIRCKIHGKNHQYTMDTLNNLGVVYGELGDLETSQNIMKGVYECSVETLGKEHPDTLLSFRNVADVYRKRGELAEAINIYSDCYETQCRVLGERHHETLETLNSMAVSTYLNGESNGAILLFKNLFDIYIEMLGSSHPRTLGIMNSLAILYYRTGDYVDAEKTYISAYDGILQTFKAGNDRIDEDVKKVYILLASDMIEMAEDFFDNGRYNNAFQLYEMSFCIRKNILGIKDDDTIYSFSRMAFTAEEMKNHKKAIELYLELYQIRRDVLGEDHEDTIATLSNLAYSYERDGEYQKALDINKSVYEIELNKNGEYHSDTLTALNVLANVYRKYGRFEDAVEMFGKGYKVCCENAGLDHPVTLKFEYSLANSLIEVRDLVNAYIFFKDLYERFSTILGERHQNTILAKERMDLLSQVVE